MSRVHDSVNVNASGQEPHFKDHWSRTLLLRMLSWDGNFDITGNLLEMQNLKLHSLLKRYLNFNKILWWFI